MHELDSDKAEGHTYTFMPMLCHLPLTTVMAINGTPSDKAARSHRVLFVFCNGQQFWQKFMSPVFLFDNKRLG